MVKNIENLLNQKTDCTLTDFAEDQTPIVRVKGFSNTIFIRCPNQFEEMNRVTDKSRRGEKLNWTYRARDFFFETIGYHFDKDSERSLKRTEKQRRFKIRLVGFDTDKKGNRLGYAYFIPDNRYD
tara:strand:- start:1624 stop:1998 length:375 start_codon:yes stop_codon:yes gene_type:complete